MHAVDFGNHLLDPHATRLAAGPHLLQREIVAWFTPMRAANWVWFSASFSLALLRAAARARFSDVTIKISLAMRPTYFLYTRSFSA
jgi:hypothetical protein